MKQTITETWHVYLLYHVCLINEISVNIPTCYINKLNMIVTAGGQLKNFPLLLVGL